MEGSLSPYSLAFFICELLFRQENINWGGGTKTYLTIGILFNLSLLGLFKYTDFFLENFNLFSQLLHLDFSIPLPHILLPLALSFVTFQQIAFLIDCYKHHNIKSIDWVDYALFITFFPQLIAGPIVHHKEMMPQFHAILKKHTFLVHWENFAKGLFIFSLGLFKKVVIADSFGLWADNGYRALQEGNILNFFESWATSLSYTFQLYFDFSGYCDMAMGIALLFGIVLPINFNSPYQALNIKDFWRRWHMTLGRFLTQYLYIPLGGSQKGKIYTLRNLFIVFVLSGIWHGAGWGFVIWGFLHAVAMMIHRSFEFFLQSLKNPSLLHFLHHSKLCKILAWILTFNFVNFAWIFFRATNLQEAFSLIEGMFGKGGLILPSFLNALQKIFPQTTFGGTFFTIAPTDSKIVPFAICLSLVFCIVFKNTHTLLQSNQRKFIPYFLLSCLLFVFSILFINRESNFLYFNF